MDQYEKCFTAEASSMINNEGTDVSAWLSGTHAFTYDASTGTLTLTGLGAWIGLVKVTPGGDVKVPQSSVTYDIKIEEKDGYDLMHISVTGTGFYWDFSYASYDDPNDEPALVEDKAPWGEDLADITPTEMFVTFASKDAADLVLLDTITSGTDIIFGVTDPAGGSTKVGQFDRTSEQYQELKLMTSPKKDVQFDNFTTVSLDVYLPSSNDYTGTLTKDILIGIAESSQTEQWWNGHIEYKVSGDTVPVDEWKTYTFKLNAPNSGPGLGQYTPLERKDLDMFFINIGGSGHTATGTFYVRNFKFE